MSSFRSECLSAAEELGLTDHEAFARDIEAILTDVLAFIRSGRGDAYEAVNYVTRERGRVGSVAKRCQQAMQR
jgi:hypothetical protein